MHTTFLIWLIDVRPWVVGVVLFGSTIGAFSLGLRLRPVPDLRAPRRGESNSYIVSALLGLLALLLGFAFSIAIQRFEERRQLVVAHANAIESLYQNVQLLGSQPRARVGGPILAYARAQLELAKAGYPADGPLRRRSDTLLDKIGATVTAAVPRSFDGAAIAYPIIGSMNKLGDLDLHRKVAHDDQVPAEVIMLLGLYLISAAGVLGYYVERGPGTVLGCFVLVLMCASLILVIDLDHRSSGGIQESQVPIEHVRNALDAKALRQGS